MIYTLISQKYATLNELKSYTVNETIDLYEVALINAYNKSILLGDDGK